VTCFSEYFKILKYVGVGFVMMGFVGFVVKVRSRLPLLPPQPAAALHCTRLCARVMPVVAIAVALPPPLPSPFNAAARIC
jgi:hypothetical protein